MNRRKFLGALGAAVPLVALAQTGHASTADEFTYRGYTVRWSGWREPANQLLIFGAWFAWRDGHEPITYATTLGSSRTTAHELDVMDCTLQPQEGGVHLWPGVNVDPDARAKAKETARQHVLRLLDAR